jgi:hypothetical protein
VPGYQSLLFLAFPFYGMMATEFGGHGERLKREFVKALGKIILDGEEMPPEQFAEIEQLVTGPSASTTRCGKVVKLRAT